MNDPPQSPPTSPPQNQPDKCQKHQKSHRPAHRCLAGSALNRDTAVGLGYIIRGDATGLEVQSQPEAVEGEKESCLRVVREEGQRDTLLTSSR